MKSNSIWRTILLTLKFLDSLVLILYIFFYPPKIKNCNKKYVKSYLTKSEIGNCDS